LDVGGDVDCSLVSVDLRVAEWRKRVTVTFCAMLFFGVEEHVVPQAQHWSDYS
jgi:hypothetical protein